jgi:hypothetical protein
MTEEVKKYNKWFTRASAARTDMFKTRKEWEEFYYNDVESTLSQFTANQSNSIADSYNIPISTKLSYPIIEQLISFLTGTKPFPRIIAPTEATSDFTSTYSGAFHGIWYESKGDRELKLCIKDAFVTGSGFIRTRKANFFNESTFNILIEHVPWKWLVIDPHSKKEDFSDAEYIFISRSMLVSQAEKEYDIKIPETDFEGTPHNVNTDDLETNEMTEGYGTMKDEKYVSIRELFYKEDVNLYISENGDISLKRPKSIMLPNQEKVKLGEAINQAMQELQEQQATGQQLGQSNQDIDAEQSQMKSTQQFTEDANANTALKGVTEDTAIATADLTKEIEMMRQQYYQMPDEIPGFEMEIENKDIEFGADAPKKEKIRVENISKVIKRRIKTVFLVGNKVIDRDVLHMNKYPIHHLSFQHYLSPNRTFGTIHYIYDLINAQNKFWSMLLFDMQVNNNRRVLYPRGAIADKTVVEKAWRQPNAWLEWIPNPALPDAGRPSIMEPSPLNQATTYVIETLKQLVEYVTGIFGVMQGDSAAAPNTMGATQSLQTFGSQRPKLYARSLEYVLQDLAYTTICMAQVYTPKEKVLQYFDTNGDQKEVEIMNSAVDMQFKVRVDIANSLPTDRQLFAQLLSMVAGQTKNPYVADFLTKNMLKQLDMPEALKMAEDLDTIKQLEGQLQQLQQQLDAESKRNKALENNLYQKDLSHKVDLAAEKAKSDVAIEEQKAIDEIPDSETTETENDVPIL